MPSSVGKSEFYSSRDMTGLWAHATLHGDGEGGVGAVMEGGVALYNAEGQVIWKLEQCELTCVPSNVFRKRLVANPSNSVATGGVQSLDWIETVASIPKVTSSRDAGFLIIGGKSTDLVKEVLSGLEPSEYMDTMPSEDAQVQSALLRAAKRLLEKGAKAISVVCFSSLNICVIGLPEISGKGADDIFFVWHR